SEALHDRHAHPRRPHRVDVRTHRADRRSAAGHRSLGPSRRRNLRNRAGQPAWGRTHHRFARPSLPTVLRLRLGAGSARTRPTAVGSGDRRGDRRVTAADPSITEFGIRYAMSRGRQNDDGETRPRGWAFPVPVDEHILTIRTRGITSVSLDRGYDAYIGSKAPWLLLGAKTLSYAV